MAADRNEGRPVLVTGSHRSGSTWVGRLLAAAAELHYVQEPFNIVAHQRWLSPRPRHQFLYVNDENEAPWLAPVERVLALRYPLVAHLRERPSPRMAKRAARIALDARRARRAGARALVKDPIAIFSTPWLVRRFDVLPVVLVRDPVAFVGSLQERDWTFDFRHWVEQPALMHDVLADHAASIDRMLAGPADIVEQGIVIWNAIYDFVDRLRNELPDAVVVSYETLAAQPEVEVEGLYHRLGLDFGAAQARAVAALSTGVGGAGDGAGRAPIDVRRDSRATLAHGRARLDAGAVERVRDGTARVAARLADITEES